jgi:hypothetical protein
VHDAIGFGVGKRPQQDAVDDAEDRGIGADAEAERQDERERDPGMRGRVRSARRISLITASPQDVHARRPGIVHRRRKTAISITLLTVEH